MTPHTVFAGPSPFGEFTPKSPMHRNPAKLSRTQALAIRAEYAAGATYRALEAKHGIARNTLSRVVQYRGVYAGVL
jgi:hypothetical protein